MINPSSAAPARQGALTPYVVNHFINTIIPARVHAGLSAAISEGRGEFPLRSIVRDGAETIMELTGVARIGTGEPQVSYQTTLTDLRSGEQQALEGLLKVDAAPV